MSRSAQDEDDDQYVSAEDSDFTPHDSQEEAVDQSDTDNEVIGDSKRKIPTKPDSDADENHGNSGDEAVLNRARKKFKKGKIADIENDGGEGSLIKTRSQRAAEKQERKITAGKGPVTIDVDALWAQMRSGQPIVPIARPTTPDSTENDMEDAEPISPSPKDASPTMVRIKRTYKFAGRVHTEDNLVAKDSAEAKLFLASQGDQSTIHASPPKRTTKKAFRSVFEPVIELSAKRADLNLGVAARMQAAKDAAAKKLNTVEKSRMDWAGFVDKEGIKDELELAGKSKDSYAARQDFLARSEALREEDSRRIRMAGRT